MDPIYIMAIVLAVFIILGYIIFFMNSGSKGSISMMIAGKRKKRIRYLKN